MSNASPSPSTGILLFQVLTIVLEMASNKQLALIPTPFVYCRGAFVNLLKFLPFPKHHLHIYASSNDLLLAARNDDSSLDFFICNPLIKQWLPIPRIPKKNYDQLGRERESCFARLNYMPAGG